MLPIKTVRSLGLVAGVIVATAQACFAQAGAPPVSGPSSFRQAGHAEYLPKVRTMLDTLIEHGRDRYGPQHSPLFAAILTQDTLECPKDPHMYPMTPVRLDPGRPFQRAPAASNQYYDQATFRCMDLMTRLTGEPKYREAVLEALRYQLNEAVDKRGFPAMGGHTRWDLHQDKIAAVGDYHELWYWPMAWDLWWAADAKKTREYADKIWEWHVVDKSTGETNRHADKQHGWSFAYCDGTLMSSWAFLATKESDEKYRHWCEKVAGYYWNRRDPTTGLFPSSGGEYGVSRKRYDTSNFTTSSMPLAHAMIVAGRQTKSEKLTQMGRAVLDSYAKYGYDHQTGLFYGQIKLDGTPLKWNVKRDLVTGNDEPLGYLAVWMPDKGWQELPLFTAQLYAWAAEEVDRKAYLPTAERFGRILRKAWQDRYAGYKDWHALREAIKPFAMESFKKGGITFVRHAPPPGVDRKLLERYKTGDYVYQAPYGLFAEHYGRTIQFSLSMHRLTGDGQWLDLAKEVADETIHELFRGKLFVGHAGKEAYENLDQVGMLLYGLLQLDFTLSGNELPIEPFF